MFRSSIPSSLVVGLVASMAAVGLWVAEQAAGLALLRILAIPCKLALLVAPLWLLADLSIFLRKRPLVAVALGVSLVAVTLVAMKAYLPWRTAFAEEFNNGLIRWYYEGMPMREGDYDVWLARWTRNIPHQIEALLAASYYGGLVAACYFRRLSRARGAAVGLLGYVMLFLVPIFTELVAWDYDTFMMGVAFDSISMDLTPILCFAPVEHSIFFYTFMLIFFGVAGLFFWLLPRSDVGPEHTETEGEMFSLKTSEPS